MARKPKQKAPAEPPKSFDEFAEDAEAGDEDMPNVNPSEVPPPAANKLRDWRDVERYKEMRELRKLIDDDYDFEDL